MTPIDHVYVVDANLARALWITPDNARCICGQRFANHRIECAAHWEERREYARREFARNMEHALR